MYILRRFLLPMALTLLFTANINARVTGIFNWQIPSSLTPAYPAPTSSTPSGEYIGNVIFSDNGVTVFINDDDVKELSRKARFYFGYNTQVPELRVYPDSEIIITAPDNMSISSVAWLGAKVGEYYTECPDGKFDGNVWSPNASDNLPQSVTFEVFNTINCTNITVMCEESAGVSDIRCDADNSAIEYFNIHGVRITQPIHGSVLILRHGNSFRKVIFH